MTLGALDEWPDCPALVITKYGHLTDEFDAFPGVRVMEAAHPVPDDNSLSAGKLLIDSIEALPAESHVLFLVSGGASALAEALPSDVSLSELKAMTDKMLATGKTIDQINTRRKTHSRSKGENSLSVFPAGGSGSMPSPMLKATVLRLSGQALEIQIVCPIRAPVESSPPIRSPARPQPQRLSSWVLPFWRIVKPCMAIYMNWRIDLGLLLPTRRPGFICLVATSPSVTLPEHPGRGGRNQSLALALSAHIAGRDDISVLVAGTDGTDGPTFAAGGLIAGTTWSETTASDALLPG